MNDEEENEDVGLRRQLGFAIQNLQFAARSRGINLGPVSAQQILDMAERGELAEVAEAAAAVRAVMNGLNALLLYVQDEGRVCPRPQVWSRLFDCLPDKRRVGNGWEPALPLILAAWDQTSDLEKRERLLQHIRWAADHGALEQIDRFIRAIPPDQWHRLAP